MQPKMLFYSMQPRVGHGMPAQAAPVYSLDCKELLLFKACVMAMQVRCTVELPSWAAVMSDKHHHNSLPGHYPRQLRPWLFW